jgi:hypothetical protein
LPFVRRGDSVQQLVVVKEGGQLVAVRDLESGVPEWEEQDGESGAGVLESASVLWRLRAEPSPPVRSPIGYPRSFAAASRSA